ncbi:L-threonine aldolase [Desulfuromusa kysingii]|uniref:L-threonine aldolase n=1 Tax=Desulfuromusa kysingii TaxID=37625 RepID=A0A1H4AX79_9BACT|nr:low-specificity L-threonine aldolase [Desulfuromusa kysingii]SEA40470.1 L-threonine aldolase [Desulfuromusa kysingii]
MDYIDLRSDTVTHPTPEMRNAMAHATVGDDVYGEDPTVNRLEAEAAAMFGMEAGLLVTSGTQGNLIALLTHAPRGSEIISGDKAHIILYEQGGMAALGGIMPRTLPVQDDGTLRLTDIQAAIRIDDQHFPRTKLVCIENTQGTVGSVPLSPEYTQSVADLAHQNSLKLHIDGARIFNAATAYNVSAAEIISGADSVTFCLSKGLGAPIGSILLGNKDFIKEAHRNRKILGGGMRQAGVLASAGLIAIHKMTQRLHEDHRNAADLAEKLKSVPHIKVLSQHTSFVFFWLEESAKLTPAEFTTAMRKHNILLSPYPGYERKFRAVLHYWITPERVDTVITTIKQVLG